MKRNRSLILPTILGLSLILGSCVSRPTPEDAVSGPREIAGRLQGRTVLSGEVVLTGDLFIPAGSVLILEEGTVVSVRPSESTKIDPQYLSPLTELLVRGALEVRGSADRPVIFEPAGDSADSDYAWAGIALDGAADSRISGAVIRGADTGILCIGSSPTIEENRIEDCRYGIIAQSGSAPKILGNDIEKGEGGVFCWGGSNPYLKYNRIAGNDEEGIFVDGSSRPILDRNRVTRNAVGLVLFAADLPFDPTEIDGNGVDVLLGGDREGGL